MNCITLIGRLTKDPDLRYTQGGNAVASFCIAVDRNFKSASGEKETDFIDIVVWRQQAESCATYLAKGSMCAVNGRLQIRSYEANDGTKRRVAEVVADYVQFLGGKKQETAKPEPRPFDDDMPFGADASDEDVLY